MVENKKGGGNMNQFQADLYISYLIQLARKRGIENYRDLEKECGKEVEALVLEITKGVVA